MSADMGLLNGLRSARNFFIRYLAQRIVVLLTDDQRSDFVRILIPDISLQMGIPMPLAAPLTRDVYCCSVQDFLAVHCRDQLECQQTRTLDLGCGSSPKNPFHASSIEGVDIQPQSESETEIVTADLFNHPIPFEDERFDFVTAFDFIEHVPRTVCELGSTRFPFVQLMDEVARVLRPGGLFLSSTPAFPSQQTFQDPTHVNPITENTFPFYFCSREADLPWARMYGFNGSFDLISQAWSGYSLLTLMKKAT